MKKRFGLIALAAIGVAIPAAFAGSSAVKVAAEGEETSSVSDSSQETVELKCKVFHIDEESGERIEDQANKYGDILISSYDGNPGDEVIAVIQGNPTIEVKGQQALLFRYIVKNVWFNGAAIRPTDYDKGEYTITLVDGANLLEVDFSGKAEISVVDLAGLNWQSLITVDNLMRLLVLAALLLVSSGFFITLIKKSKIASITGNEFSAVANKIIDTKLGDFLKNDIVPIIKEQTGMSKEAADNTSVIMRVLLLSCENTPEARLEIIKELQKYKSTDSELAQRIEEIVNSSIEKRNKAEQDEKAAIEETKKAIEELPEIKVDDDGGFGSL